MIRYLVKNNMKLMMRSVTNVLLFIIMPIILVALLSSAFNDLMKKYEGRDHINAGFRYEGEKVNEELIENIKEAGAQNGLVFTEYSTGEPEDILKKEELGGFVVFKSGSYTVYQNGDMKEDARLLEYFLNSYFERMRDISTASSGNDSVDEDMVSKEEPLTYPVGGDDAAVTGQDISDAGYGSKEGIQEGTSGIRVERPEHMKDISSQDYYGIIEIIYFSWCAIVCGAGLFASEKKYRIGKKLQVSSLNGLQLYLGKFIPMFVVVSIGSLISAGITIILFGVHWGNPLLSVLLILLSAAAATALGLMVYSISDNMVVTIIAVFSIVWVAGFVGGSFETYMYSSHPDSVKLLSPLYHINRALVELSCMGHSDYIVSALIYGAVITVVCSAIALFAGEIRRRGKA